MTVADHCLQFLQRIMPPVPVLLVKIFGVLPFSTRPGQELPQRVVFEWFETGRHHLWVAIAQQLVCAGCMVTQFGASAVGGHAAH